MAEKKENDFETISLPAELLEKVDLAVKEGFYHNRAEFVRDAIRHRLLEIQTCNQEA
jgi:metal-responsive CopG/Arc/MetJ family transcriptional regulator